MKMPPDSIRLVLPRLLLKTHVNAYTRKDGAFVAAHEDKRSSHSVVEKNVGGHRSWDVLHDGKVVGNYAASIAKKKVLDHHFSRVDADAQKKAVASERAKAGAAARKESAAHRMELDAAMKRHGDVISAAHHNRRLNFKPMSRAQFEASAGIDLHRSGSYGAKKGSGYRLVMVDGKPAYARDADHWGEFYTTERGVWDKPRLEDGDAWNEHDGSWEKRHEWNLEGHEPTGWGGKDRKYGYVHLDDLKRLHAERGAASIKKAFDGGAKILLLKAAIHEGKFKHSGKYYLQGSRWHKLHDDKPAPKGAPVAHDPHKHAVIPAQHLTGDEWAKLKLPDSNTNASTFNGALDKIKEWSESGNVAALLGVGLGTNTYAKKLAHVINHVLAAYGSPHKVTPGQKPGTHAAVQGGGTEPAPAAEDTQALKDKLQMLHDFLKEKPDSPNVPAWKAKIAEIEAKVGPLKTEAAAPAKPVVDTSSWSAPTQAAFALKQDYEALDKLDNKAVGAFKTKLRALAKKTPEDDQKATMLLDGLATKVWGTDYDPKVAGIEFAPAAVPAAPPGTVMVDGKPLLADKSGKPKVYYHGTGAKAHDGNFKEGSYGGIYFASDPNVSATYVDGSADNAYEAGGADAVEQKIFARSIVAKNPMIVSAKADNLDHLHLVAEAKKKGHDALVLQNVQTEDGDKLGEFVIVFSNDSIVPASGAVTDSVADPVGSKGEKFAHDGKGTLWHESASKGGNVKPSAPAASTPSAPAPIKSFDGVGDTAVEVHALNTGKFSVVVKDKDTGEAVPSVKIYPTQEWAESAAENIAAGKPGPKEGDTKPAADGGTLVLKDGHWVKQGEPAPTGNLSMPDFQEGKTTTGVKALYEKTAQKLIDHAHAGNLSVVEDMPDPGKKMWQGKTANSKKLLALHAEAVASLKGSGVAGIDPEAKALEPAPAASGAPSKLAQIPWAQQMLPTSNSNAASHNKAVAKIQAMAEAGDVAGLQAFVDAKAGAKQTYAKKQGLLAQAALSALQGDAPAAEPSLAGKPAYDHIAHTMKAGGAGLSAADKWIAANPGAWDELNEALTAHGFGHLADYGPSAAAPASVSGSSLTPAQEDALVTVLKLNFGQMPTVGDYADQWNSLSAEKKAELTAKAAAKPAEPPDKYPLVTEWKAAISAGKAPTKAQAEAYEALTEHDPDAAMDAFQDAVNDLIPPEYHNDDEKFDEALQDAYEKAHELHGKGLFGKGEKERGVKLAAWPSSTFILGKDGVWQKKSDADNKLYKVGPELQAALYLHEGMAVPAAISGSLSASQKASIIKQAAEDFGKSPMELQALLDANAPKAVEPAGPAGVDVSALSDAQKQMLYKLIGDNDLSGLESASKYGAPPAYKKAAGEALAKLKATQPVTADTPLGRKQLAALESLSPDELNAIKDSEGLPPNVKAWINKKLAEKKTALSALKEGAFVGAMSASAVIKEKVAAGTSSKKAALEWIADNPGKEAEAIQALKDAGFPSAADDLQEGLAPPRKAAAPAPAAPDPEQPKTFTAVKTVFHNTQPGHNKSWSVYVAPNASGGHDVVTEYGKIGGTQQKTVKSFSTLDAAIAFKDVKVKSKKANGYSEKYTDYLHKVTLGGAVEQGPKEGDTKMGADGMLVLKDGHWVKMSEDKPAPKTIKKLTGAQIGEVIDKITPGKSAFSTNAHGKMAMKAALAGDGPAMAVAYSNAAKAMKFPQTASHIKAVAEAMGVDTSGWGGPKTPQSEPAPAAAPSASALPSADTWVKTGEQEGSNPGGKFKDPSGQEWYVKWPNDPDAVKSEILAAKLYALAGLSSQDCMLVTKGGKTAIATKWVNIKKAGSAAALAKVEGVHEGFAVDAWLGNWDVIGLSLDNLQIGPDGKAHRVDAGGSLEYRAQGEKKPFGAKVEEIDTLRDAGKNENAAAVFGKMTEADITASVAKVAAISDVAIRAMVNEHGPGDAEAKKKLADTLIARKQDLLKRFPKAAKAKKKHEFKPEKISAPPSFLNWGGSGKSGPSSKEFLNQANENAVQAIFAAAKTGDIEAVKKLTAPVLDKATGAVTGYKPVLEHPSQHVNGYAQQAINEINYQLNPPKRFRFDGGHPLHALNNAYPAHAGAASSSNAQKLGKFIVLGDPGTVKLDDMGLPAKITHAEGGGTLNINTYAAAAKAAFSKMPATQKQAVQSYTGSSYHEMNGSLWSGNPTGAAKSAAEALKTLGHDIAPGTVLSRKISLHGSDLEMLLNAQGKILQEPAIMSTSIRPPSWSGNVHLKLHVGPGVKGLWVGKGSGPSGGAVSKHGGEDEMILPPNTRLLILSTKKSSGVDADGFGGSSSHVIEAVLLPSQ